MQLDHWTSHNSICTFPCLTPKHLRALVANVILHVGGLMGPIGGSVLFLGGGGSEKMKLRPALVRDTFVQHPRKQRKQKQGKQSPGKREISV